MPIRIESIESAIAKGVSQSYDYEKAETGIFRVRVTTYNRKRSYVFFENLIGQIKIPMSSKREKIVERI